MAFVLVVVGCCCEEYEELCQAGAVGPPHSRDTSTPEKIDFTPLTGGALTGTRRRMAFRCRADMLGCRLFSNDDDDDDATRQEKIVEISLHTFTRILSFVV